ncbi:TraB/GumN family protein [Paenibacillus sinopodophylli]|uniref:TraB/GumN family protein n=1 Tax=Paenibacillus sinopodophylli TaxID=1837342 RepID=UPI00110CCAA3|nr:TraB/GumN family protein [Paenibacillus sinopodophylli]
MRKFLSLFLSLALLFSFVSSVQAEAKPISIWVGDEQVQLGSLQPIMEKGTTLVPAKLVLQKLNFQVTWDQKSKVITGKKDGLVLSFQIDHLGAIVNNTEQGLLAAPKLVKGIAYIPLRTVSEAAGYEIVWNKEQQSIALQAKATSQGFLWKVEKAGSTVYLLGSIHIASKAMYPLRSEIQKAYEASDYLVVEADISKMNDADVQQLVLDLSVYKDQTTLKDHISADAYQKIGDILEENGLEPNVLDTYKPWSVSSSIDYLSSSQSGYDAGIGIDAHFLQQAIANNKPILELESIEYQLQMFNRFSDKLQEEMLLSSIASYYTEDSSIDHLTELWTTGNEEQLLELTDSTSANEELNKALLTDRNAPMVDKITGYLNDSTNKTYFVVVGAAHMLGENGIVPLLEKKGFAVTRQ